MITGKKLEDRMEGLDPDKIQGCKDYGEKTLHRSDV